MCLIASMASRFSVRDNGRPALRSSTMKPASRSSIGLPRAVGAEFLGRLGDVRLVLQQDVQRVLGLLGVDVLDAEEDERAGPVERLRDRGVLLQLDAADRADD